MHRDENDPEAQGRHTCEILLRDLAEKWSLVLNEKRKPREQGDRPEGCKNTKPKKNQPKGVC